MTITDAEFVSNLIIQLLTEDPSKIIEAKEDADSMVAAGAAWDATHHELMAEYCIYIIQRQNPHLPELAQMIKDNQQDIEVRLFDHFRAQGW